MHENDISKEILDVAFHIHIALGPGLLEAVYEEIMHIELVKKGLAVERQKIMPVMWDGRLIETGYRADLIVENKVIVELKSIQLLPPVTAKVLLTYLKVSNLKLGLIINFSEKYLKNGIKRIVNEL